MRIADAILPVMCALVAAVSTAEQTQPEVAPVALYKSPKVIEWGRVPYPKVDLTGVHEGWAIVNLMVDPEGNPYEATIVESIGGPAFEKAALAQALKSRFEPASMSGTPIHAGTSVKLYFQVPGIPQDLKIRDEYPMQFQEVLKAVEAGDRERADAKLARLDAHNLYEDAYRAIAEFAYYLRWGTEAQQISALRRAIAGERDARYLPKAAFEKTLWNLLPLEVRTQDYARALQTWETLLKLGMDQEGRTKWQKSIDEIQSLRDNDKAYTVPGEFADRSSWHYELLKRRFRIDVDSGTVAEVKLRCDQQYVSFRFDPTLQYTISGNNKSCSMELVGQPGTKFRLTQS